MLRFLQKKSFNATCHVDSKILKVSIDSKSIENLYQMTIGNIDLNNFVDGEMPITMEMRSSGELCAAASHVLWLAECLYNEERAAMV